jgi:hypothetical protein
VVVVVVVVVLHLEDVLEQLLAVLRLLQVAQLQLLVVLPRLLVALLLLQDRLQPQDPHRHPDQPRLLLPALLLPQELLRLLLPGLHRLPDPALNSIKCRFK